MANVEGVTKCLIWNGEANEDDGNMFPHRLRRIYEGTPPHLAQHFCICDATAPTLVQALKPPEPAISIDQIRKSRLLWTWLRREAAFDVDMEGKILRERKERLAKQQRLQEYHHVEREPLCRRRDYLPPAIGHFKRAVHLTNTGHYANCGGLPTLAAAAAAASPRGGSARVVRAAAFVAVPANNTTSHHHPPAASLSPRARPMSSTVKRKIAEMAERFGA